MVDQETMNPAVVVEAMRIIDETLEAISCRGIVSASEMIDHFLDLRSLLGPLLTIEA